MPQLARAALEQGDNRMRNTVLFFVLFSLSLSYVLLAALDDEDDEDDGGKKEGRGGWRYCRRRRVRRRGSEGRLYVSFQEVAPSVGGRARL